MRLLFLVELLLSFFWTAGVATFALSYDVFYFCVLIGIDGQEGMKHICGTIVARKKARQGREGKV
jgi:hypothetical protein